MDLKLGDIVRAQHRLRPHLRATALEAAPDLGVWLKLENCNHTHSFKIRGALNAILSLPADAREPRHNRRIIGQSRRGCGLPPRS